MQVVNFSDPRMPERFWEKCIPEPMSGCWLWVASYSRDGYGAFRFDGQMRRAHAVAYRVLVGPVPDGLELDHRVCRNTACCNPAHLEPVTHSVNMARSARSLRAECKNGHPFSEANVYRWNNARICRVCTSDKQRAYKQRRTARAA